MAERRMFAKSVIGSARFLRMPATSRLLYYDLGMEADDDGCVEAFSVMRKTGSTEDDLRVLASKGFVRVLNEDLVSYIQDWNTNNQIRKDRYHSGVYKHLIDSSCKVMIECGNQVATMCQPHDNQMATEVRLGKCSVDKVSVGEDSVGEDVPDINVGHKPTKRFTPPAVDEVRAYCQGRQNGIDPQRFVDYYTSNGWMVGKNKMKDWKAAVRTWEQKDGSKGRSATRPKNSNPFLDMLEEDGYE